MGIVVEVLASAALTVFTAFIPIAVRHISRRLALDESVADRQNLETALKAAAGLAYSAAVKGAGPHTAVTVGTDYVVDRMAETMERHGLTVDRIPAMVEARMGHLMAVDATVQGPKV
ncbi:hypothetical protein UFOVP469_56 [uncultured Caudovirales phage]|uniref:Uncharacterized protein n=1 Tax=uncultured Caudovirales phage TaxID=2100421 RepID=A0A6J5R8I7_9CAUD|nr:hypothetical protein UFOVP469_56 [uncultured Caudovirales phage]CAB4190008.1 hypothetical protein UFOVP1200_29 [uncultured Caudovirales phage]